MSLFFISKNININSDIQSEVSQYIKNIEADLINVNYQIIFSKDDVCKKQIENGYVWGFGVFFNENGFYETALKDVITFRDLAVTVSDLFGHFVFVVEFEGNIYIITDKVGMINVFYTENDAGIYVSSSLPCIGLSQKEITLNTQSVKEFIFTESSIGEDTVLQGVKRLTLGKSIKIIGNRLEVKDFHNYEFEKLELSEYIERIEKYFRLLNKFDGTVSTDLSGGFDTRLVASISHKFVDPLEANTNTNRFDGGVDDHLSKIIANKLKLSLLKINNGDEIPVPKSLNFFFNFGRDFIRSRNWINRLEKKYDAVDLSLGGYGGEVLRAKYNSMDPSEYYKFEDAIRVFGEGNYEINISKKLSGLYDSFCVDSAQYMNFIYAVDRMRIWGGVQVYLNFLFGKTLHPFMDWHLMGPVFSFPIDDLKEASLQKHLILHFAPQLTGIPVNKFTEKKVILTYKSFFSIIKSNKKLYTLIKKVFYKIKPIDNDFNLDMIDFESLGVSEVDLRKKVNNQVLSRLYTLNESLKYLIDSKVK